MNDQNQKMCLRDTIIPKSDQLNYDDVMDKPIAVRVTGLAAGSQEQPVIVRVAAMDGTALRDYKPCKSMRRVLIACWGDKGRDWIGKAMTLVGDPSVVFGGVRVGGIRVAAVSGIDAPRKIMLTTTRSKRSEYVVEAMMDETERASK
jgi:hypothetical protein